MLSFLRIVENEIYRCEEESQPLPLSVPQQKSGYQCLPLPEYKLEIDRMLLIRGQNILSVIWDLAQWKLNWCHAFLTAHPSVPWLVLLAQRHWSEVSAGSHSIFLSSGWFMFKEFRTFVCHVTHQHQDKSYLLSNMSEIPTFMQLRLLIFWATDYLQTFLKT